MKINYIDYEITLTVDEYTQLVDRGYLGGTKRNGQQTPDFTPGLIDKDEMQKLIDNLKDYPKVKEDRPRPYDVVAVYGCYMPRDWGLGDSVTTIISDHGTSSLDGTASNGTKLADATENPGTKEAPGTNSSVSSANNT